MHERLEELKTRLGEVSDLRSARALLDWDQMVMMPPAGAAVRAHRQATLGALPTSDSPTIALVTS